MPRHILKIPLGHMSLFKPGAAILDIRLGIRQVEAVQSQHIIPLGTSLRTKVQTIPNPLITGGCSSLFTH